MKHKLRDYQQKGSDAIYEAWNENQSTLLVLPTGCVSGDAVIGINRAKKGYSRKISDAFHAQFSGRQDSKINTLVRVNIGHRIGLHAIQGIVFSGEKRTFTMTLADGKSVRLTEDHQVQTADGFKKLCDCSIGERIICESQPVTTGTNKKHYKVTQGLRYHPFAGGAKSLRRRGNHVEGRMHRVAYHRLVAEARLNNILVSELITICRTSQFDAMHLRFLDPEIFAVHHIDQNHKNNTADNLEVMTHEAHLVHHGNGAEVNFGYGLLGESNIVSIDEYGFEPTYDIVCTDPHRNFVANGIVVHNCGKTQVFTDVIHRMAPRRSIVLAHREELIWQARNRIEAMTGLTCEVEMADMRADCSFLNRPDVIVTTVQTQCSGCDGKGRMSRFKPEDFGLLVVDECHHIISPSYRKVLDYYKQNPNLKILGVTATPDRTDEEALGQIFQSVAFDYEILDAIHEGWLVPIDQQMVNVGDLDFSDVRTTAGDLNGSDLAAVMESEGPIQSVVMATVEAMYGLAPNTLLKLPVADWGKACEAFGLEVPRRTLAFASSVRHAEMLSDILNRVRPGTSAWVCGATPKDERRMILQRFDAGEIPAVANCAVLTEGFDSPAVQVIVMARPTKSRSLYSQMVGRATRPLPGLVDPLPTADERKAAIESSSKKAALIIDFVGNSGRHKLMTSADILGGNVSDAAIERAIKKAKNEGKAVRMSEVLDRSEEEIQAEILERKRAEEARKARLVAKARYTSVSVNPFDVFQLQPVRERGWDTGKQLSEKQRELLRRQSIDPDSIPYGQAKALLNELFRRWGAKLATFKQCKLLGKHGYETKNMTMKDATKLIDQLAKNGWKRPVETAK